MCAPFTFSGVKTTRGSITPVFFLCLVVCKPREKPNQRNKGVTEG